MNEQNEKEIHFGKNKRNQRNNIIERNVVISPNNQKIKYSEEKKMEINTYCKTSDFCQKIKQNDIISSSKNNNIFNENDNYINTIPLINNNSKILINKEQLYETFLLFQQFLMATNGLDKDKFINNPFISKITDFKEILKIKKI